MGGGRREELGEEGEGVEREEGGRGRGRKEVVAAGIARRTCKNGLQCICNSQKVVTMS